MVGLQALLEWMRGRDPVAVAFSGGVDSTLVALASRRIHGDRSLALTVFNPSVPGRDRRDAIRTARLIGIELVVMEVDVLKEPDFIKNPPDRCYFCKRLLMGRLLGEVRKRGLHELADGGVSDDVDDYRPGMRAADELGILHPLMDVGITKRDVREILKEENIDVWSKPPSPCLASRIPYNEPITLEKMRMVDVVEERLKALGLDQVRLRLHETAGGRMLGVAEVDDMERVMKGWEEITRDLPGGIRIVLDPRGYRRGSLNDYLAGTGDRP